MDALYIEEKRRLEEEGLDFSFFFRFRTRTSQSILSFSLVHFRKMEQASEAGSSGDGIDSKNMAGIGSSGVGGTASRVSIRALLSPANNVGSGVTKRPRPHVCTAPGCSRAFSTRSNLKAHARTHSGETPYACAGCKRTFRWRSSLKCHLAGCEAGVDVREAMMLRGKIRRVKEHTTAEAKESKEKRRELMTEEEEEEEEEQRQIVMVENRSGAHQRSKELEARDAQLAHAHGYGNGEIAPHVHERGLGSVNATWRSG